MDQPPNNPRENDSAQRFRKPLGIDIQRFRKVFGTDEKLTDQKLKDAIAKGTTNSPDQPLSVEVLKDHANLVSYWIKENQPAIPPFAQLDLQHLRKEVHDKFTAYKSAKKFFKWQDQTALAQAAKKAIEDYLVYTRDYIRLKDQTSGDIHQQITSEAHTLGFHHPNEDAYFSTRSVHGVFDGLSTPAEGHIASSTAKTFIEQESSTRFSDSMSVTEVSEVMRQLLIDASKAIYEKKLTSDEIKPASDEIKPASDEIKLTMRSVTTASVVKIMKDGTAVIGNVGDSRVYLLTKGGTTLKHLTIDKGGTDLEKLKIQQQIAQLETFENSPKHLRDHIADRHLVKQVLGHKNATPTIYTYQLKPGDTLILTTDGIHDNLTDAQMITCIRDNPSNTAMKLTALAEKISGQKTDRSKPDDMTVVIMKVGEETDISSNS